MYNLTIINGWLGAGGADLARIGGPATTKSRRQRQILVFANVQTRRSGVQQQA